MSQDPGKRARAKLSSLIRKTVFGLVGISSLNETYHAMGILNYQNQDVSGEKHFVQKTLRECLRSNNSPIFFDIGANIGKYTLLLRQAWPDAEIWAFEPNPHTHEQLAKAMTGQRIQCRNLGFGTENATQKLYVDTSNQLSSHASIYKQVHAGYHHTNELDEVSFEMQTLDHFCSENQISLIDFLKIDTEGNELAVLQGAANMLAAGKLPIIQFEFGECHVFSRTFLRDFYDLLVGYRFFRLGPKSLIPLGDYNVSNEIFRFQNIVALHPSVRIQA
jgi:FkbM family methyltransferase